MRFCFFYLGLILITSYFPSGYAHEVRPAYLQLKQIPSAEKNITNSFFHVIWKQPMRGGKRLKLTPDFPDSCVRTHFIKEQILTTASVKSWNIACNVDAFAETSIEIGGLSGTIMDVFITLEYLDGKTISKLLNPSKKSALMVDEQAVQVSAYFSFGLFHLLSGFDHLLFIFALMYFTRSFFSLLKTITAFTIAHSITLAVSIFNVIQLSQPAVEAAIALSILFLAYEASNASLKKDSLTLSMPWKVAFVFGLLHGFGFASALSEIGLPENTSAVALLLFNFGIEAGQLLIVSVILAGTHLLSRWARPLPSWLIQIPIYAIGTISSFWLFQQIAVIFAI
ncbi:MAG: HupE/UreJ family protein [Gammaproteobacteria bacterium]|nr:MAG: HupE/UreJ family protein [Gammaproteobacteria bacterium]